jgi:small subunit ribosomal protein S8
MTNDPIGDMLTRIRNALLRHRESVELPHSKMKEELAKVLVKEGYLKKSKNFKQSGRPGPPASSREASRAGKMLHLDLKYDDDDGESVILKIRRLSKPGQRIYSPAKKLSTKFRGITVVSTSQGLMTARQARKKGLGGELVAEVI